MLPCSCVCKNASSHCAVLHKHDSLQILCFWQALDTRKINSLAATLDELSAREVQNEAFIDSIEQQGKAVDSRLSLCESKQQQVLGVQQTHHASLGALDKQQDELSTVVAKLQQQAAEAQRSSHAELHDLKELLKQQAARHMSEVEAMTMRLERAEAKLGAIQKDEAQLAATLQLERQDLIKKLDAHNGDVRELKHEAARSASTVQQLEVRSKDASVRLDNVGSVIASVQSSVDAASTSISSHTAQIDELNSSMLTAGWVEQLCVQHVGDLRQTMLHKHKATDSAVAQLADVLDSRLLGIHQQCSQLDRLATTLNNDQQAIRTQLARTMERTDELHKAQLSHTSQLKHLLASHESLKASSDATREQLDGTLRMAQLAADRHLSDLEALTQQTRCHEKTLATLGAVVHDAEAAIEQNHSSMTAALSNCSIDCAAAVDATAEMQIKQQQFELRCNAIDSTVALRGSDIDVLRRHMDDKLAGMQQICQRSSEQAHEAERLAAAVKHTQEAMQVSLLANQNLSKLFLDMQAHVRRNTETADEVHKTQASNASALKQLQVSYESMKVGWDSADELLHGKLTQLQLMSERNLADVKMLKDEVEILQRSEAADVKAKDFLEVKNQLAQLSQAARQTSTRADETDKWCSRIDKLTSEHQTTVQHIQASVKLVKLVNNELLMCQLCSGSLRRCGMP